MSRQAPPAARAVTDDEVTAFARDGFVMLPGVLPLSWVEVLREGIDRLVAGFRPSATDRDLSARPSGLGPRRYLAIAGGWQRDPAIRDVDVKSPLPQIAARLLSSAEVRLYDDLTLFKAPGAVERLPFHREESYLHLGGSQVCLIWVPVDVVSADSGILGYLPGSHRWRSASGSESFTDEHGGRARYVEAVPGDVIVHHYRTLHESRPNTTSQVRRALSVRYVGDDVRFVRKSDAPAIPHHEHELQTGDRLDCEAYPIVWPSPSRHL
jgi:Phytanoyl-CoA dioxygenase (PhyH)